MNKLDSYTEKFMKKTLPVFEIGDSVDVITKIEEGKKIRNQRFSGTVIAKKGHQLSSMFTVRRIVQGEGIERTFPIHSPKLITVKVNRKGRVRRAKLYYLRDRVGKATKVKERICPIDQVKKINAISKQAAEEAEARYAEIQQEK